MFFNLAGFPLTFRHIIVIVVTVLNTIFSTEARKHIGDEYTKSFIEHYARIISRYESAITKVKTLGCWQASQIVTIHVYL